MEKVCAASNKIHDLAGVALDPGASMSVSNLKQAILEIHDAVVALQNITSTTCLSLQQKDIYPYESDSDTSYGEVHVDDMGDGYNNDV